MSYGNQIFEKGPDGNFRLAGDRTDSLDSLQENKPEEKKITDSAVSLLLALKFYPFRAPFFKLVPRVVDGLEKKNEVEESRQFDVPDVTDQKDNHLGVMALGVDFGIPGDSGFGYGEEWPFKRRLRGGLSANDEDSVNVESSDKK